MFGWPTLTLKNPRRAVLLKCPFCGGKAVLQIKPQSHLPYYVDCILCHTRTTYYRIMRSAVTRWNNRV